MEKILKSSFGMGLLIVIVVSLGSVFAGDVVIKEGDLTAGAGRFLGGLSTLSEEELIDDPEFAGSIGTTWETTYNGNGWAISGGQAYKTNAPETLTEKEPFVVKSGTTYRIIVDIETSSSSFGGITVSIGGDSEDIVPEGLEFTGVKTAYLKAVDTTDFSLTVGGAGDEARLNSISIKEIGNAEFGDTEVVNLNVLEYFGLTGISEFNGGELSITGREGLTAGGSAPDVLAVTGGKGMDQDGMAGDGADIRLTSGDGGGPACGYGGDGGYIELTTGAGGEGGAENGDYGNIILAKNGGIVLIGTDTVDGTSVLQVDGIATADEWADWTAAWTGTKEEALQSILNIRNKNGEIDHKTLPDLARVDLSYYINVNCRTVTEDVEWNGVIHKDVTYEKCDKQLVEKEGRSLGGMITVLVEAVKALEAENQMLKDELCSRDNSYSWCE